MADNTWNGEISQFKKLRHDKKQAPVLLRVVWLP